MTAKDKLKTLEKQIADLKEELLAVGPMRPGSLSRQYNVCGNPKCRCKDPENPKKHGPYYQLSYVHRGQHTTQFVKAEQVVGDKGKAQAARRVGERHRAAPAGVAEMARARVRSKTHSVAAKTGAKHRGRQKAGVKPVKAHGHRIG